MWKAERNFIILMNEKIRDIERIFLHRVQCEEKNTEFASSLTDNAETLVVNVAILSSCAAIFVFISLSWDCFSLI